MNKRQAKAEAYGRAAALIDVNIGDGDLFTDMEELSEDEFEKIAAALRDLADALRQRAARLR